MAHIDIGQNSVLNLYSNVEVSEGLQVAFSSAAAQYNYFSKRLVKQYTGMSYVYRNGVVKIQDTPQVVARANYISFNNPSFESKPIYARITNYQYVNNATVKITYSVDWFQTFMFDVDYRSCQIMREHLSEADWTRALKNPWDRSILELNTAESFTFSDEDRGVIDTASNYRAMVPEKPGVTLYICMHLSSAQFTRTEGVKDVYSRLAAWIHAADKDYAGGDNMPVFGVIPQNVAMDGVPRASAVYFMHYHETISGIANHDAIVGENPNISGSDTVLSAGVKLLTAAGLSSEIISMYCLTSDMIKRLFTGMNPEVTTISLDGRTVAGSNPKLKRAPFSYLKAVGPDGTAKEYKYENFASPSTGIAFADIASFDGVPTYSLIPVNYKYGHIGGTVTTFNLNFKERLDYAGMMQIAYNIDSFLTYMAGEYQKAIQNTSWPALVKTGARIGASVADSFLGNTGSSQTTSNYDSGGRLIGSSTTTTPGSQSDTVFGAIGSIVEAMNNLGGDINAMATMRGTGPIYDYGAEKATYIADQYVAGGGSGYLTYRFRNLFFSLYFITLNDAMTQTVDNYFNAFGYNSGRIGVPRICNFIKASGAAPHFVEIDDGPATFVKTGDMHVVSNLKPASDYIEALFNAGCRFIKGDGR